MDSKNDGTENLGATHCSTVSIIDFQVTIASLSVAEHALREEPYPRLPYLAGMLSVTAEQMERLRQEAMSLRIERDRYKRMASEGITDVDCDVPKSIEFNHHRVQIKGGYKFPIGWDGLTLEPNIWAYCTPDGKNAPWLADNDKVDQVP